MTSKVRRDRPALPLRTTIAARIRLPTAKETSAAGMPPVDLAEPGVDRRLHREQAADDGGQRGPRRPYPRGILTTVA